MVTASTLPMAVILLPSVRIVPFSITSSPFIEMMRAPFKATIPVGKSDLSTRLISVDVACVFGVLPSKLKALFTSML
ncbi:hypothetical protein D3C85_1021950 [compost metagenome]